MKQDGHSLMLFVKDNVSYSFSVVDLYNNCFSFKLLVIDNASDTLRLSSSFALSGEEDNMLKNKLYDFCEDLMIRDKSFSKASLVKLAKEIEKHENP